MRSSTTLALAASFSVSSAVFQGFNYASTNTDGSAMGVSDFKAAFDAQQTLDGITGFSSARLYTMIDAASSQNDPISALQAASDDGVTSLLLGMWCSAGQAAFDTEIIALNKAIKQFPNLSGQIAGLSIGSEDLYRQSNIANKTVPSPGPGVEPAVISSYISQVKGNLTGTSWSGIKIGHVDTWTAWTNDDGSFITSDLTAIIDACDFLGIDSYPYFEGSLTNPIEDATALFDQSYQAVLGVSGDKEVWITETGWPVSGPTQNLAVPSKANAQTYWQNVGCPNFGKINTWWYTFDDSASSPTFGVVDSLSGGSTNWDLSCSGYTNQDDAATGSTTNASTSTTSSGGSSSTGSGSSTGTNGTTVTTSNPKAPGSTSSGSSSGSKSGSHSSGASMVQASFVAIVGGLLAMAASL